MISATPWFRFIWVAIRQAPFSVCRTMIVQAQICPEEHVSFTDSASQVAPWALGAARKSYTFVGMAGVGGVSVVELAIALPDCQIARLLDCQRLPIGDFSAFRGRAPRGSSPTSCRWDSGTEGRRSIAKTSAGSRDEAGGAPRLTRYTGAAPCSKARL